MKSKYIITIKYYGDKTKQLEIEDWYNMGKYVNYKTIDGSIKSTLWEKVVSITTKETINGKV